MKFREDIEKVAERLGDIGIDYLLPTMDLPKDKETNSMIPGLVQEHFEKIDNSSAIFVVDPGGYVGNSVKVEIGYAKGSGKKVYFLEKAHAPELDCLADDIVAIDQLERLKD